MILVSRARSAPSMGAIESAVWPLTGELVTETNSLALQISQLGHDIGNSVTPNTDDYFAFERAWNTFVADFGQWQDASWLWNPTRRDQLLEYRATFNRLLDQSKSLAVVTQAVPLKDTPGPDVLDKIAQSLTKIGIVVGAAVLVGVGYNVWKETRRK